MSAMVRKYVIVDGRGHLMGRLASIVAKQVLSGQKVVIVRCEDINISGSLFRNKLKYHDFLHKRTRSNPKKGPFHFRAPSRIFYRVVRGMIPHKTARGQAALNRLKVFEGVPPQFQQSKRMVVPEALRVSRLAPGRKFCSLGKLAALVGWKYEDVVNELENKRKAKSAVYHRKRNALAALLGKAKTQAAEQMGQEGEILGQLGF